MKNLGNLVKLWETIHELFERDFNKTHEEEIDINVLLLDGLMLKLKEYQERDGFNANPKVLSSFFSISRKKYKGSEYLIEIGSVLGEKTIQFMISLSDPKHAVVRNEFIYKNALAYRLDFDDHDRLLCLSKIHRLDHEQKFI